MVTNAEKPEPGVTHADRVVSAGRMLIAGHPAGAVRRIVLYLTVSLALGALAGGGTVPLLVALVGLAALLLLAMTDDLA